MRSAPIIAKREVEAPTLMLYGSMTALKMFPPTPPRIIKRRYLYQAPSDYSI